MHNLRATHFMRAIVLTFLSLNAALHHSTSLTAVVRSCGGFCSTTWAEAGVVTVTGSADRLTDTIMSPEILSDHELIAESAKQSAGSREAIVNELFERHYDRVSRWCLRFSGDPDAAADLAQDVFLKAHRHFGSFKGSSRFSTWLYTIVRNESLNRIKRGGPPMEREDVLEEVAALEAGPEELAERSRQRQQLRDFLSATLDRVEHTVFSLHYGDDRSLDEITRLLNLDNASGAKAFIVSAKRKLARATQRVGARGERLGITPRGVSWASHRWARRTGEPSRRADQPS